MPHPSNLPKLLVVEDDPAVLALLVAYLEKDGYRVDGAASAREAARLLAATKYALILLDLGLPDEDGLVVARRLRTVSSVPIVFVTERSGHMDKITALEMGGDDYITKPFNPRELSARVRNILARVGQGGGQAGTVERIAVGPWWLDEGQRTLENDLGEEVALSRAEFDILRALALARGRVLSRDTLLDAIDSRSEHGTDRTIDVLISRVRKKIEANPRAPNLIITVPGLGYRLVPHR